MHHEPFFWILFSPSLRKVFNLLNIYCDIYKYHLEKKKWTPHAISKTEDVITASFLWYHSDILLILGVDAHVINIFFLSILHQPFLITRGMLLFVEYIKSWVFQWKRGESWFSCRLKRAAGTWREVNSGSFNVRETRSQESVCFYRGAAQTSSSYRKLN